MKLVFTVLFSTLLLASCSPSTPKLTPQQEAVTNYLKKTLDDPASYQPVRWSNEQVWREKDQARLGIEAERFQVLKDSLNIDTNHHSYQSSIKIAKIAPALTSHIAKYKAAWQRSIVRTDSLHKRIDSLLAVSDTTRLGYLITHTFRAKNKMGGLVLDSARFEVQKNGQVRVFDSFKE
jgi:hypothetical protein